jgi:iron complex transport system substrate-binding protein
MRSVHRRKFHQSVIAVLTVAVAGLAAGCAGAVTGSSAQPGAAVSSSAGLSALTPAGVTRYPVTVASCTGTHTYAKAPSRVVSLDDETTDTLISLGLASKIVGAVKFETPAQEWAQDASVVAKLPGLVAKTGYPSLEALLALRPDFVTSYYQTAFTQGIGPAAPARWASLGVGTYQDNCGPYKATLENNFNQLYYDIHNLGVIFNVQASAASLIGRLQAEAAAGQALARKARLGDYKIGMANGYLITPGSSPVGVNNAVITEAGSTNAFAKYAPNQNLPVSKEQFVATNPQVIWLVTEQGLTVAQEEHNLQSDPQLKNVQAIKNRAYVPISYWAFGVRLADAFQAMVKGLITLKHEGKI